MIRTGFLVIRFPPAAVMALQPLCVTGTRGSRLDMASLPPADRNGHSLFRRADITVLYGSYAAVGETGAARGFACLIEIPGQTILFDTGSGPGVLMHNVEVFGVDAGTIDPEVI